MGSDNVRVSLYLPKGDTGKYKMVSKDFVKCDDKNPEISVISRNDYEKKTINVEVDTNDVVIRKPAMTIVEYVVKVASQGNENKVNPDDAEEIKDILADKNEVSEYRKLRQKYIENVLFDEDVDDESKEAREEELNKELGKKEDDDPSQVIFEYKFFTNPVEYYFVIDKDMSGGGGRMSGGGRGGGHSRRRKRQMRKRMRQTRKRMRHTKRRLRTSVSRKRRR